MIQWPPSQHVATGAKMKSSCQSVHLPTVVDVDKKWMSQLALPHLRNSVEDMIHVLSIQSFQHKIWWNYYIQHQLLFLEFAKSRLHHMPLQSLD
ncbi:hypothetical protein EUGRSUZ_C03629 [Eucalyptus grandis]|uniref:Uncharacterized protein n=2 Tax=Eucalyptus grandis TaxID=71139 RepID=A0ACC3LKI2_EUCGR|nr:hypothetical protein EUGRSUZ_C03629 [Eucalyptus grandis]